MAPPPCIGIDLGAAKTMVVGETGEIVRNELGGHSSSASLVGFSGDERYAGEGAVAQLATNAKTRRASASASSRPRKHRGEGGFTAFYAGAETAIADDALAASLLRNVGSLANKPSAASRRRPWSCRTPGRSRRSPR